MGGGRDETSDGLIRDGANVGNSEWRVGGSEGSVDFVEGRSGEECRGVFLIIDLCFAYKCIYQSSPSYC